MHALRKERIVDIFVWVDDALASAGQIQPAAKYRGGRHPKLSTSETVTILLVCSLTAPQSYSKTSGDGRSPTTRTTSTSPCIPSLSIIATERFQRSCGCLSKPCNKVLPSALWTLLCWRYAG